MRAAARIGSDLELAGHVLRGIEWIAAEEEVLTVAQGLEPFSVRSLDAIHVASAMLIGDELEALISYDRRMLLCARLAGLPTRSPGRS